MTKSDLSPIMRKAYEALSSEEEKLEFLDQCETTHKSLVRGAIPAIMARNFSHNVGKHLLKKR